MNFACEPSLTVGGLFRPMRSGTMVCAKCEPTTICRAIATPRTTRRHQKPIDYASQTGTLDFSMGSSSTVATPSQRRSVFLRQRKGPAFSGNPELALERRPDYRSAGPGTNLVRCHSIAMAEANCSTLDRLVNLSFVQLKASNSRRCP